MDTTHALLGRELDDAELAGYSGAASCTVYIIMNSSGQILDVVAVGDCRVEHRIK